MGLLDDAIREHLDLKRRRGADPTEVEREEREVLGPVRRRGEAAPDDTALLPDEDLEHEPLPLDDAPWEERAAPGPTAAFDHEELEDDEVYEAPAREVEPDPYAVPAAEVDPYEHEEPPRPYAADAGREPDPYGADPYGRPTDAPDPYVPPVPRPYPADGGHEPEPAAGPYRADPGHYAADPGGHHDTDETTAEFNVEDVHAAENEGHHGEGAEEDVLEETPDFLQDTPDHDRLWFEQRPPRDFDFDG